MRAVLAFCIVIALTSIGLSLLALPDELELAFMRYKDKQYSLVEKMYRKELDTNKWTPKNVYPLMQTYISIGQPQKGIAILNEYIQRNPSDPDAISTLSHVYQNAQMTEEYIKNLELQNSGKTSGSSLHELQFMYELTEKYTSQIQVMKKLVEFNPNKGNLFSDLASLQASQGDISGAINTLLKLNAKQSPISRLKEKKLLFSLLVDQGNIEKALELTKLWFSEKKQNSQLILFGEWLNEQAMYKTTMKVMSALPFDINANPDLLKLYIYAEINSGARNSALLRLQNCEKQGLLPNDLIALYIELALERNQYELVKPISLICDPPLLPEWLKVRIVEAALVQRDIEWVHEFISRLDVNWLNNHELLSAKIAMTEDKQKSTVAIINKVLLKKNLSVNEKLSLAELLIQTKQFSKAEEILISINSEPDIPQLFYRNIAYLFINMNESQKGYAILNHLVKTPSTHHGLKIGWALLSIHIGKYKQVNNWLKGKPYIDFQSLKDIYYIARRNKQYELALICASRMYILGKSDISRKLFSYALLDNGREKEALKHIRKLNLDDKEIEGLYISALKADKATHELTEHWVNKLKHKKITRKEYEETIHDLISIESYQAVLPFIRKHYEQYDGEWLFIYVDISMKVGNGEQAVEILIQQASKSHVSREDKRKIAYNLLDFNKKSEALDIFKWLAISARPEDPDVLELVHLWGPRPEQEAVEWVSSRVKNADIVDKVNWLNLLFKIGGDKRIVQIIKENRYFDDSRFHPIYIEALYKTKQISVLERFLEQNINDISNTQILSRYLEIANQIGNLTIERIIIKQITKLNPDQAKALRAQGMLSFRENNYPEAIEFLNAYLKLEEKDFEAYYYLAESLYALKRFSSAAKTYEFAINLIVSSENSSYTARSLRMLMLARINKTNEARDILDVLQKEKPDDIKLLTNYIEVLYEKGLYREAAEALEIH